MMTRSTTTSVVGRASAMRRQRRRTAHASNAPYCGTNGCASLLTIDASSGVAQCEICGFTRRLH